MASVGKIAEMIGKGAGKAKLAAGKMASTASKAASGAVGKMKSMDKKDIAASVRGAVKSKPKPMVGMTGDKTGNGMKVATGVVGAGAVSTAVGNASKGGDRQAKETGTPNVEKKVTSSSKPTTSPKSTKPTVSGKSGNKSPDRIDVAKPKGSVYRATKGDGLWQVAEKTVPKGQSVSAWWAQIKKLNSTNGKVNRVYQNSAIKLPPGAQPKDKGYQASKPGGDKTTNKMK